MVDELRLSVGGSSFRGWEDVELVRSIEAVCGSFRLKVSDKARTGPFPIQVGAACTISIGEDLYLTGWVDALEASLDARAHEVVVSGRDIAGDLVDCSPVDLDSEYYGVGLLELARTLAAPFKVEVELQPGADEGEAFGRFALQVGETAHESIERACRLRGFLATTTPAGVVTLTRAADPHVDGLGPSPVLREGDNVSAMRCRIDWSDRFARYVARGQQGGSDLVNGADCSGVEGEAFDTVPRSTRTMALLTEGSVDPELAQLRATWEANVRAARATVLTVTTNGWRQGGDVGPPWTPNVLVEVDLPSMRLGGTWLVAGVRLARTTQEGTTCDLALARPDAYLPQPPDPELEPDFSGEGEQ